VRFGDCAYTAAEITAEIADPAERAAADQPDARHVRFFCSRWNSIDARTRPERHLRVWQRTPQLLWRTEHAIESDEVQRYPLQLDG